MDAKKIKKIFRVLSIVIVFTMAIGIYIPNHSYAKSIETEKINKTTQDTFSYMLENSEGFSDAWSIIGLARSGFADMDKNADLYLNRLKKELIDNKGILSDAKYTEYSRATLSLTALGIDPRKIEGYNLVEKLSDMDKLVIQGINGPIWALIALDSNNYSIPKTDGIANPTTRDKLIDYILEKEISGGGWSLSSDLADVDITAMALTALAPYKDNLGDYINRGLDFLSSAQHANGGFESMDAANAESNAQVIVALTSLGIDPLTDTRFIKNGNSVLENLIDDFYDKSGGFSHVEGMELDKMATDQAFYALVSYKRFKGGEKPLFQMADIEIGIDNNGDEAGESTINPFKDIDKDPEKAAIIELNKEGIINGVTKTEFQPNKSITRAEFAALITRALDKEESHNHGFTDVNKLDWFSGYVGAAKESKLINGYPDNTFRPQNNITKQEAAMIIYNIAKSKGIDTKMGETEIRNYLSQFPDYIDIGDWSKEAMAFGVKKEYIPNDIINIEPTRPATRSEVAGMLYRLLY